MTLGCKDSGIRNKLRKIAEHYKWWPKKGKSFLAIKILFDDTINATVYGF